MEEQAFIPIFCETDNFCRAYEEYCRHSLMMDKKEVIPKTQMSLSEIMTILISYQLSGYRIFKWYYKKYVIKYQRNDFPELVSYHRFVEIMKFALVPLLLYTIKARCGKCSGISFVDSTSLHVCDNHHINSHRIFKKYAQRGKAQWNGFTASSSIL